MDGAGNFNWSCVSHPLLRAKCQNRKSRIRVRGLTKLLAGERWCWDPRGICLIWVSDAPPGTGGNIIDIKAAHYRSQFFKILISRFVPGKRSLCAVERAGSLSFEAKHIIILATQALMLIFSQWQIFACFNTLTDSRPQLRYDPHWCYRHFKGLQIACSLVSQYNSTAGLFPAWHCSTQCQPPWRCAR